jgi:hypothetical protein
MSGADQHAIPLSITPLLECLAGLPSSDAMPGPTMYYPEKGEPISQLCWHTAGTLLASSSSKWGIDSPNTMMGNEDSGGVVHDNHYFVHVSVLARRP